MAVEVTLETSGLLWPLKVVLQPWDFFDLLAEISWFDTAMINEALW